MREQGRRQIDLRLVPRRSERTRVQLCHAVKDHAYERVPKRVYPDEQGSAHP